MTQSELAERSSTTQSAISMFESGRPDALADDKLRVVAETLGIDLAAPDALDKQALPGVFENKYCPTPDCPGNAPYLVSGQVCVLVNPVSAPAGERTCCRLCGEIMESRCPNPDCREPVTRGAFCTRCGRPYATATPAPGQSAEDWVRTQQQCVEKLTKIAHETRALTRGTALPCLPSSPEGARPDVI